ncbi:uncharacterized protein LOC131203128 [Ahaetulla prasina]|uniref:uncharacterized protein LOC131203128 n=1 Tax=Ahaetulla prasina TaxID=499056 RepID=UPI0026472A51|nr:uncharacterized protein LOC131203128 [Ahaetulla prasina]
MRRSSHRPSKPSVPSKDLSLSEAYNLLAALMQFVAMVLLCVAIYMRNWVWLEPDETYLGRQPFVFYTFGIPYKMNATRNGSDYLYFFQKDRRALSLIVIMVCFLNLCFGVTAFLLDYLEFQMLEKYRIMLVSSFHISSGVSSLVLVAICIWCFEKVTQWAVEPEWMRNPMLVHFGESFYIGLLAFGCAVWAVTFTLCALVVTWKLKTSSEAPDAKQ